VALVMFAVCMYASVLICAVFDWTESSAVQRLYTPAKIIEIVEQKKQGSKIRVIA